MERPSGFLQHITRNPSKRTDNQSEHSHPKKFHQKINIVTSKQASKQSACVRTCAVRGAAPHRMKPLLSSHFAVIS